MSAGRAFLTTGALIGVLAGGALLPGGTRAQEMRGGRAGGQVYTLAMSMVLSGTLAPLGRDMERGAELAVAQQDSGQLGQMGVAVDFRALDDAVNGIYSGSKDAANARAFAGDPTVFAEDGPYNSGASAKSMPIYNWHGLTQISPGNTLPDLTEPRFRARYEPATAKGKRGITYFRTCTTDAFQGVAGVQFAVKRFHPRTAYVVNDQGLPGIGLADTYQRVIPRHGIRLLGRSALTAQGPDFGAAAVVSTIARLKPDVVFLGADPETGGQAFADDLRRAGLHMPLIGGDALLTPTWIVGPNGAYHPGSQNSWFTAIGPNPLHDPRDRGFVTAYRARFHSEPTTGFSALAYDAANIELNALAQALREGHGAEGVAALREAVRANVAAMHYQGIGGSGHFNANGDTTNRVISMWHVNGRTGKSFQWLGYAPGFLPHK